MNVTLVGSAPPRSMPVDGALTSSTGVTTGHWIPKEATFATFQFIAAAAGVVVIEGTNEALTADGTNNNAVTLGTITLAAAGSDGFTTDAMWRWVRARITAGTATMTVLMGI